MNRIQWIKRLLTLWFRWRNRIRGRLHCPLAVDNCTGVDKTRCSNDLINASGIDFRMMQLERIIRDLPSPLRDAVYALYGGREWIGMTRAANRLSIHRKNLHARLCAADRAIEEALDGQKEDENYD